MGETVAGNEDDRIPDIPIQPSNCWHEEETDKVVIQPVAVRAVGGARLMTFFAIIIIGWISINVYGMSKSVYFFVFFFCFSNFHF